MTRIVFLTPDDIPYGFAIAGFEQKMCGPDMAADILGQAVAEADVGVIVIDERLLVAVGEDQIQRLQKGWNGILLVLPDPTGAMPVEEDYLQRLIRRALGYHVRIRE